MVETGLLNAVATGIVTGSVVALGAIGLALVYSIAEVPNFAQGELLTIGAYVALLVNKPGTVPGFELLATGTQSSTTGGLVVVFLLASGAVLTAMYLFGGASVLRGEWWSVDVPDPVPPLVHAGIAAAVGGLVVVSTPSIWGGMLLGALVLAVLAPLQEKMVFRAFRRRGADLATMLIVALGLSFCLRYGTQAIFGGQVRDYAVPNVASVFGSSVPFSAAQNFDFYVTATGVALEIINTRAIGAGESVTVALFTYPWPMLGLVVAVTLLGAAGGYRWRREEHDGYEAVRTIGPALTALGVGAAVFVVTAFLFEGGSVSDATIYATRIKLSVARGMTVLVALAMMFFLHVSLQQTRLGTAMRASSDNLDLAQVTGINTRRVMVATWIIAGVYGAVGGVMLGVLFGQVTPNLGFFLLLPMFAAVILGGVGSIYGAILGSFVIGLSMDIGLFLFDVSGVHRVTIAFIVLLVVLLIRPQGIRGVA